MGAEPFSPKTEAIYLRMIKQADKLYAQAKIGDATACDAMVLLFAGFFAPMMREELWPRLLDVVGHTMQQAAQIDRTLSETEGSA